MVTKLATKREGMRPGVRGRPRGKAMRHPLDPLDETREVESDYLESLLHDLGDTDVSGRAIEPPHDLEEHEDEHEEHEEAEEPEERAAVVKRRPKAEREYTGMGPDIADVWTMKSGRTPLLSPAQEILLAK